MDGKGKINFVIHRAFFVLGIVLIVLFGFMLICNLVLIIKSYVHPEEPPKMFKVMPMVVRSGSMSGDAKDHIEVDDLIFILGVDPVKLEVGDIIAYRTSDKIIVTHRIVSITSEEGELRFVTRGDANNVNDEPFTSEAIIGVYKWRIPKIGGFALFLQTPLGTVLAVVVPVALFLAVDLISRKRKKSQSETPADHTTDCPL